MKDAINISGAYVSFANNILTNESVKFMIRPVSKKYAYESIKINIHLILMMR